MIIREATVSDAPAIARVHVDTWRSAYAGIVPANHLAALSYEQKAKTWAKAIEKPWPGSKTFVADAGAEGGVVAFAAGGNERSGHPVFKGELFVIYVSDKCQRRGIGRQLVRAVVNHLRALGFSNMITWAFVDNAYTRFYEMLGGTPVGEKYTETGGKLLKEIALGCYNLPVL